MERETGIEPATNGLGSRYSTIELLPLDNLSVPKPEAAILTPSAARARHRIEGHVANRIPRLAAPVLEQPPVA
jgi:hypothetical protein